MGLFQDIQRFPVETTSAVTGGIKDSNTDGTRTQTALATLPWTVTLHRWVGEEMLLALTADSLS